MSERNKFYFACIIIKSYRICERSLENVSRGFISHMYTKIGGRLAARRDAGRFFSFYFLRKTEMVVVSFSSKKEKSSNYNVSVLEMLYHLLTYYISKYLQAAYMLLRIVANPLTASN